MFRVLVTGSRTWTDTHTIHNALTELHRAHGDALVIVHGACPRGADAITSSWCTRQHVAQEPHPADWVTHGRSAGPRRNAAMIAAGVDLVLAFIVDNNPGAKSDD